MGNSSSAHIYYGFNLGFNDESDIILPWIDDNDDDIEKWWRKENNYVNPFELYEDNGYTLRSEYQNPTKEQYKQYFDHQKTFDVTFQISTYYFGHHEYPGTVIALKMPTVSSTDYECDTFDPGILVISDYKKQLLMDFVKKYIPDHEFGEPSWLLCSNYG